MKRFVAVIITITAAAFVIANCGGGLTKSSGKTLVTINGKKVTEGDIEFLGKINPRIAAQLASPAGKKRILDNLVEQELLYQEAVKKGINRDPEVRAKAELYRRVIVAQSLLEKELEASAKKFYEENPNEFEKLKLSQILIRYQNPKDKRKGKRKMKLRSEKEALKLANKALDRINKGEDFAKVAKELSDDAATKQRGGDLGEVSKDDKRFKARGYGPLVEKAFEMKVSEVAGPIKTERGYHIIMVTRGVEQQPFDDAEKGILFKIRGNIRKDIVAKLKKDGNVTFAAELAPKAKTKPAQPKAAAEKTDAGEIKATPKEETKKEETKKEEPKKEEPAKKQPKQ